MHRNFLPSRQRTWATIPLGLLAVALLLTLAACDSFDEFADQVEDGAKQAMGETDEPDGDDKGSASGTSDSTAKTKTKVETKPEPPKSPREVIAAFAEKLPGRRTDEDLAVLGKLEAGHDLLPELDLQASKVTPAGLASIEKFQGLTVLSMENTNLGLDMVEQISKFQNLQELSVDNNPRFDDQCLAVVCQMPNLKLLSISATGVTDEGLAHLEKATQLQTLRLNRNGTLTGSHFPPLATLTELQVSRTTFGEHSLQKVAQIAGLEVFYAREAGVLNKTVLHLKKCSNLRELHLSANDYLTSDGFAKLKGLRNLEVVHVDGCLLMDGDAMHGLTASKGLRELNVKKTKIPAGATTDLKEKYCKDVEVLR